MRNACKQVALTYLRRPFSSFSAFVAAFGIPVLILLPFVGRTSASRAGCYNLDQQANVLPLLTIFFAGTGLLFGLAAIHIKEQFADPRARLMPGFRGAHVAGAVVAFLAVAIVLPLGLAWHAGLSPIGMVAVAVVWLGLVSWASLLHSTWLIWLFNITFLASLFGPGARVLGPLCFGEVPELAVVVLLGGLVAVGFCGRRLIWLNEDMPEYHRRFLAGQRHTGTATRQASPGTGTSPRRGLRERCEERRIEKLIAQVRRAPVSRWSKICRWRAIVPSGRQVYLTVGATTFLTLVLLAILCRRALPEDHVALVIAVPAAVTLLMPAVFSAAQLEQRVHWTRYELHLPVGRAAYVRQVGAEAALCQIQCWGAMIVAIFLWWLLFAAKSAAWGEIIRMSLGVTMLQVWMFGTVAWAVRHKRVFISFVVIGLIAVLVSLSFMTDRESTERSWSALWAFIVPLSGLLAAIGVLMTWAAYRRWLVTDID
jgi:hypothetical protein